MAIAITASARRVGGVLGLVLATTAVLDVGLAKAAPAPATAEEQAKDEPLIYIFSGALTGAGETYSGTLVAAADGPAFELKLGKGATCDNTKLDPDKGLLRLPETPCSDGRKLKALFVYQEGGFLRVYGSVGDERFSTQAHALPADAPESAPARSTAPPADLMDKPR
jgi:hypothetical protein